MSEGTIFAMVMIMLMSLLLLVSCSGTSEAGSEVSGMKCHQLNEATAKDNYEILIRYTIMNVEREDVKDMKAYLHKQLRRISTEYLIGFKHCEKIRLTKKN